MRMYGCESWSIRKAEHWRTDAFELWCWSLFFFFFFTLFYFTILVRVPWTAKRSNQSILKEIIPQYSLEGLMLYLQYFGHLYAKNWLTGKDADAEKDWRWEEKGRTEDEDEMVGWYLWLDGHEFGWTPGVGDGQGGLACCSPWGHKELDATEWLNWTELMYKINN